MAYTIQDLLCGIGASPAAPTGGVWDKLSQRYDILTTGKGPQWIADAIVELSRDYPFEDLENTTPNFVPLTAGVNKYPISTWLANGDTVANLVPSFYMFYSTVAPVYGNYTSGVPLKYKSIDVLDALMQTSGPPAIWTRFGGSIYVAPTPDTSYYTFMRYQAEHHFSKPAALTDPVLLPNEWREIAEYAGAMRGAGNLRMLDFAQAYKQLLFGDPKKPGELGLIAARVTQNQSDIVSGQATRQIRPASRR